MNTETATVAQNEQLDILADYQVFDNYFSSELSNFPKLASHLCKTPIAYLSVFINDAQLIVSGVGVGKLCLSKSESICAKIVTESKKISEVHREGLEMEFAAFPVVKSTQAKYYGCQPLTNPKGQLIGTLCVLDTVERTLDPDHKEGLELLAQAVTKFICDKKRMAYFESYMKTAHDLVFEFDQKGTIGQYNEHFLQLLEYKKEEVPELNFFHLLESEEESLNKWFQELANSRVKDAKLDVVLKSKSDIAVELSLKLQFAYTLQGYKVLAISRNKQTLKPAEKENLHYTQGLRLLNTISSDRSLSLDDRLEKALNMCRDFFDLEIGIISKVEGDSYQVRNFFPHDSGLEKGMEFLRGNTYCDITLGAKKVIAINSMKNSRFKKHPCYQAFKLESYIGSHYKVNDHIRGTINFSSSGTRAEEFSGYDLDFMNVLARWVGNQIEIHEHQLKLEEEKEKLRVARDLAEQSKKMKADFLATMSHEIRTPLNAIIGTTNLLTLERPDLDANQRFQTLKHGCDNLLHLVNNILDYQKLKAGALNIHPKPTILFDSLKKLTDSWKPLAAQKGLRLFLDVDMNHQLQVVVDDHRLTQALNNLISNALKFTDQGSVVLHVKEMEGRLKLAVEDSGRGVPEKDRALIFESFKQSDHSNPAGVSGTGLGLPLVKEIIELMEGHIHVESTQGVGSVFVIDLPLVLADSPFTAMPAASKAKVLDLNILVAEDNKTNQLLAQTLLEMWQGKVDIANNGKEAYEMIREKDYDVVLMDLRMPEWDGYQATAAIRRLDGKYTKLPIIALTASTLRDSLEKVRSHGFNDYVVKPFDPDDLFDAIQKALQQAA